MNNLKLTMLATFATVSAALNHTITNTTKPSDNKNKTTEDKTSQIATIIIGSLIASTILIIAGALTYKICKNKKRTMIVSIGTKTIIVEAKEPPPPRSSGEYSAAPDTREAFIYSRKLDPEKQQVAPPRNVLKNAPRRTLDSSLRPPTRRRGEATLSMAIYELDSFGRDRRSHSSAAHLPPLPGFVE
jgi:hypothetical protein